MELPEGPDMAVASGEARRTLEWKRGGTLQTATGRVAGFLYGQSVYKGQKRTAFELDMPKGVLASRLSVKPETFSRILHSFIDQGLVNVQGAHVEFLNTDGLRQHAESAGICGQAVGPAED